MVEKVSSRAQVKLSHDVKIRMSIASQQFVGRFQISPIVGELLN